MTEGAPPTTPTPTRRRTVQGQGHDLRRVLRATTLSSLIGVGLLSLGCATYELSVPQPLPAGAREDKIGGGLPVTRLSLEGMKLWLRSLDETYPHETAPTPSFMVWLAFEPANLGYSFNPMKVTVRTPEGIVLRPRAYTHPKQGVRSTEDRAYSLPKGPSAGFFLAFDTVVTSAGVSLTIDGVAKGGQPVVVPTLPLARHRIKEYRGVSDTMQLNRPPELE